MNESYDIGSFSAGSPNIELLNRLLHILFGSGDMRLSIIDSDGVSLGRHGTQSEFCSYLQHSRTESEKCTQCTMQGIKAASETLKPYSYRCHMGLIATIIPIVLDGKPEIYLIFSGYRTDPATTAGLPAPLPVSTPSRESPDRQNNAYYSQERIQEIIELLSVTAGYLVQISAHTKMLMDLQDKSLELLTRATIREQEEKKASQQALNELIQRTRQEFLYDVLNMISLTAMEEGAPRTARLAQDLANRRRRDTRGGRNSFLGQEIDGLRCDLRLLQAIYQDRIRFSMEVGPECDPDLPLIQLPFASILDMALSTGLSEVDKGGVLRFTIRQTSARLELSIAGNSLHLSPQELKRINRIPGPPGAPGDEAFLKMIGELRAQYGGGFRWNVAALPPDSTVLSLYLPIEEEPR